MLRSVMKLKCTMFLLVQKDSYIEKNTDCSGLLRYKITLNCTKLGTLNDLLIKSGHYINLVNGSSTICYICVCIVFFAIYRRLLIHCAF